MAAVRPLGYPVAMRDRRPLFDLLSAENFPQIEHETVLPARDGKRAALPQGMHLQLADALAAQGIKSLWTHQAECWAAAQRGEDFMVTTGTASGKSLCFNLPVLDGLLRDPHARAIYLYPTKALAQDQLRRIRMLAGRQVETAAYDGDTPAAARQLARQKARVLLTNPDMIHVSLLPRHERWVDFFHNLRYVVIDEAHTYRGVFGSNVANVLRRLRRVASFYGAEPAVHPGVGHHPQRPRARGQPHRRGGHPHQRRRRPGRARARSCSGSRRSSRKSSTCAAAPAPRPPELLAELVRNQIRSICFTKSRRTAELIYQLTADRLKEIDRSLAQRLSPYRAGYTPEQRRGIEAKLFGGELLAVVSTSALELGIDIGALDAAITVGYPGTMASLWQQCGRAGRGKGESLGIFIAGNDALEQFFVTHPDLMLEPGGGSGHRRFRQPLHPPRPSGGRGLRGRARRR